MGAHIESHDFRIYAEQITQQYISIFNESVMHIHVPIPHWLTRHQMSNIAIVMQSHPHLCYYVNGNHLIPHVKLVHWKYNMAHKSPLQQAVMSSKSLWRISALIFGSKGKKNLIGRSSATSVTHSIVLQYIHIIMSFN